MKYLWFLILLAFLSSCTINIVQTDGSDDAITDTTSEDIESKLSIPVKGV